MARLGRRFFNSSQILMEGNPGGHTGTALWEAVQPGPVTPRPGTSPTETLLLLPLGPHPKLARRSSQGVIHFLCQALLEHLGLAEWKPP